MQLVLFKKNAKKKLSNAFLNYTVSLALQERFPIGILYLTKFECLASIGTVFSYIGTVLNCIATVLGCIVAVLACIGTVLNCIATVILACIETFLACIWTVLG